jgi:hypothetical protein
MRTYAVLCLLIILTVAHQAVLATPVPERLPVGTLTCTPELIKYSLKDGSLRAEVPELELLDFKNKTWRKSKSQKISVNLDPQSEKGSKSFRKLLRSKSVSGEILMTFNWKLDPTQPFAMISSEELDEENEESPDGIYGPQIIGTEIIWMWRKPSPSAGEKEEDFTVLSEIKIQGPLPTKHQPSIMTWAPFSDGTSLIFTCIRVSKN